MPKKQPITAKALAEILAKLGDRKMFMASDEEGNSYSTIVGFECLDVQKDCVVIYPWETIEME